MFKDKIKILRKEKGYTQDELAAKLMISRQSISKWENGLSYPTRQTLKSISEKFNIAISDLLDSDEILMLSIENNKNVKAIGHKVLIYIVIMLCALLLMTVLLIMINNKIDNKNAKLPLSDTATVGFIILDDEQTTNYYQNQANYDVKNTLEQNNYPYRYLKVEADSNKWYGNMIFTKLMSEDRQSYVEQLDVYLLPNNNQPYFVFPIIFDASDNRYSFGSATAYSSNAMLSVTININSLPSTYYQKTIEISLNINFAYPLNSATLVEYNQKNDIINEVTLSETIDKYSLSANTVYFIISEVYQRPDGSLYQNKIEVRYSQINQKYVYQYKKYQNRFAIPFLIIIDTNLP